MKIGTIVEGHLVYRVYQAEKILVKLLNASRPHYEMPPFDDLMHNETYVHEIEIKGKKKRRFQCINNDLYKRLANYVSEYNELAERIRFHEMGLNFREIAIQYNIGIKRMMSIIKLKENT